MSQCPLFTFGNHTTRRCQPCKFLKLINIKKETKLMFLYGALTASALIISIAVAMVCAFVLLLYVQYIVNNYMAN